MIAPATSDVLAVIVAVLATIAPAHDPSPTPPLDYSGGITYTILHLHPHTIDDDKIITI